MNRWHAHPIEDDMVGWLPEEAPPFTGRQLLLAFGAAIPVFFLVGLALALAFFFLGGDVDPSPGWLQ